MMDLSRLLLTFLCFLLSWRFPRRMDGLVKKSRRTLDWCIALDETATERFQNVGVVAETGLLDDIREMVVEVPEQKSFEFKNAKDTILLE